MIRIPSSKASDRASSTRIEYKPIDNTVNPYLALAGILAAGRDGLDRELNPGDPVERDPDSLSESERTDRSIERYPETLAEALDALADNEVLREALGDPIVDSYVTIKRAQWKEYNSSLSDWEEEHLRGRY
jgi:glutamine synthetase